MSQLTYKQATDIARGAGFTGNGVPTIVAIGAAESGLKTEHAGGWLAISGVPGNMGDPNECARAAYSISNGGKSFGRWSTYTHGEFLTFLGLAQQIARTGTAVGDSSIQVGDVTDTVKDAVPDPLAGALGALGAGLAPLKSLEAIAELVGKAGAWIADRHNWIRILEITTGVTAVFVGAFLVSKDLRNAAGKLAEGAALTAAV